MAIDADPRICLAFLYKNDPFYSLCLSDLLTAPQQVKNKFLKEQKSLTTTIKKLEHQKLSRLRQLEEEKKQFGLLMKKKLAPRVTIRSGSSIAMERDTQRTFSSIQFSSLASSKSSWKSLGSKPSTKPGAGFFSTISREFPSTHTPNLCKASSPYFPDTVPAATIYKCPHSKKRLKRSEGYMPLLGHTMLSTNFHGTIGKRN